VGVRFVWLQTIVHGVVAIRLLEQSLQRANVVKHLHQYTQSKTQHSAPLINKHEVQKANLHKVPRLNNNGKFRNSRDFFFGNPFLYSNAK
jgi:hypothetical protein